VRSIRARLIRLAWDRPEFRKALLPLLRHRKVALRVTKLLGIIHRKGSFGLLSAFSNRDSRKQNRLRNIKLITDVQRKGYRYHNWTGEWEEGGRTKKEKSVLIPDVRFADLLKWGKEFDQDAVIFKHPSGAIGMYYQKTLGAEVAVKPDGELAAEIAADESLFSKGRGISFELGFLWGQRIPWDGRTPFTKDDIQQMMQEQLLKEAI